MKEINYQYYIDQLLELCKISRLRYNLFDLSLSYPVSGQCNYVDSKIMINEPKAKSALITIAHEMGHYFSYLRNLNKDYNKDKREQLAYLYGWGILSYINSPISKEDWRGYH